MQISCPVFFFFDCFISRVVGNHCYIIVRGGYEHVTKILLATHLFKTIYSFTPGLRKLPGNCCCSVNKIIISCIIEMIVFMQFCTSLLSKDAFVCLDYINKKRNVKEKAATTVKVILF